VDGLRKLTGLIATIGAIIAVFIANQYHVPTIGMILIAGITAGVIGGIIAAMTRGKGDT
jgi:membrane-bound ClpP family serine protease